MGHARFSPSNSGRWLNCTMSMLLPEKKEERKNSSYALRGTAIHAAAEDFLLIGTYDYNKSYEGYTLTTEDVDETLFPYVAYVNNIDVDKKFIELKVKITDECYGTADFVGYNTETGDLHIADLKAGKGVFVYVKDNTQMQIYAIGAVNHLKEYGYRVKRIFTHVVQPGMDNIASIEVSMETLKGLRSDVIGTIKAVNDGQGEYECSEEICKWCVHKTTCPFLSEEANRIAADDFASLALSEKMEILPKLKIFIKAVEAETLQMLQQDKKVPGFKLVRGLGNRKWKDEHEVAMELCQFDGELDGYSKPKLLSVAQMEKAIKKAKIDFDFDLTDYITRPESAPKVVKEEDPRSGIDRTEEAKAAFKGE